MKAKKQRKDLNYYKDELTRSYTHAIRWVRRTAKSYLKNPLTTTQKKTLCYVVLFLIVTITVTALILPYMMNFFKDPSQFKNFADKNPILAAITLIVLMFVQIVLAFLPGEPIQLAAGYAFGAWMGALLSLIGSCIGSAIVFLLVKRYGTRLVHMFISEEKLQQISFINDSKRLNVLIFILMFIPGTPKDVITYMVGLTPMRLTTWLLISTPARTPSLLASTYAGASFKSGNHAIAILVLVLTALVALLGIVYYSYLTKQANQEKNMKKMAERYKQQLRNQKTQETGTLPIIQVISTED